MRLIPIPPAQIDRVWPRVRPWLLSAARRPGCDLSAEQMKCTCLREEGQLIVIRDRLGRSVAAGVTQVREGGPDGRSCWVLAVGGSGAQGWRHTLADIEAGAARLGCVLVEFVGRPGWARLLPDYAVAPCEAGTHYAKRLG